MIGPLLLVLALALSLCNVQPALTTPQELAAYTACKPHRIAFWFTSLTYKVEPAWPTAEMVMRRRAADCKGVAVVARDTLALCGYQAFIKTATGPGKIRHAFTIYQAPDGKKGFINFHQNTEFSPATPWDDVVKAIPGGPWRVE